MQGPFELARAIATLAETNESLHLLLLLPDAPSQRFVLQRVKKILEHKGRVVRKIGALDDYMSQAGELTFFSSAKTFLYPECAESIKTHLPKPIEGCRLIVASSSYAQKPSDKNGWVIIEFPQEKPWETQGRIRVWTEQLFLRKKKKASAELITQLAAASEFDLEKIAQEVEKITLFAAEQEITLAKASAISSFSLDEKEWEIAEDIIWKQTPHTVEDTDSCYRLLGLLRYHVHLGLLLSSSSNPLDDLRSHFPKMEKKAVKTYIPALKNREPNYFTKASVALGTLERNIRSGSQRTLPYFWDTFLITLRCLA